MLGSLGGKRKKTEVTPGTRCADQLSDLREAEGQECIHLDIATPYPGLVGGYGDQLGQVSHQISTDLKTFNGETSNASN
jgi:hypothetical protein